MDLATAVPILALLIPATGIVTTIVLWRLGRARKGVGFEVLEIPACFAFCLTLAFLGEACGGTAPRGSAVSAASAPSHAAIARTSSVCPAGFETEGTTWAHALFPACSSAPYIVPFAVCESGKECARPCRVSETFEGATGRRTMVSLIHYDSRGRFASSGGRLNYRWVIGFDRCSYEDDRLVSCDYADHAGREKYQYDSQGRLVGVHSGEDWMFDWGPDGVVAARMKGRDTRYSFRYGSQHRLTEWSLEGGLGEASMLTTFEYDDRGRLAKTIVVHLTGIDDAELRDRAAEQPAYRYDANGHVTDDDRGIHYDWDDRGRLVRAHTKTVDTTWDYDCSEAPSP